MPLEKKCTICRIPQPFERSYSQLTFFNFSLKKNRCLVPHDEWYRWTVWNFRPPLQGLHTIISGGICCVTKLLEDVRSFPLEGWRVNIVDYIPAGGFGFQHHNKLLLKVVFLILLLFIFLFIYYLFFI